MTTAEETKHLAPWTDTVPTEWRVTRLDAVADVLFSNVDKHTIEGEEPVRLCDHVDGYRHDRITADIDFMEASAEATCQLKTAGEQLGIPLLDHIIFNRTGYFSFLESGEL